MSPLFTLTAGDGSGTFALLLDPRTAYWFSPDGTGGYWCQQQLAGGVFTDSRYLVRPLPPGGPSCTCKGWKWNARCKHVDACRHHLGLPALRAAESEGAA